MIVAELRNYGSGMHEALRRHKVLAALYVVAIVLLGQWRAAQIVLLLIATVLILAALIWRYRDGANLETHRFQVWQRRQYAYVAYVWSDLILPDGSTTFTQPSMTDSSTTSSTRSLTTRFEAR